jgi:GTP:adenosylcobinamide-phosphate guanylyltransferase
LTLDVIITAGGKPAPDEPLYSATGGNYKALLDIHGKPMIQWVLDALDQASLVERIFVVGLPAYTDLTTKKPLALVPDQGGMLENIQAGVAEILRDRPQARKVLAGTSDIPAITPQMVDWLAGQVLESDHDIYYTVIAKEQMEARFPGARRSYVRLKNMEICGGDLNAIDTSVVGSNTALYHRLITARKSAFRQAALLGYDTLFLLLLHQMSLEDAVAQVSKRLGIRGRALLSPYPELGMDVDKPHQLEIMRRDLAPIKQNEF